MVQYPSSDGTCKGCRLLIAVLKAIGAATNSTLIISHEFMGMPTALAATALAVTAEIKIGDRSVIEYFLSPLLQHASESLHER